MLVQDKVQAAREVGVRWWQSLLIGIGWFESGITTASPRPATTRYLDRGATARKDLQGGPCAFQTTKGTNVKTDQLQADVKEELLWEPKIDSKEIAVYVSEGTVTLRGPWAARVRRSRRSGPRNECAVSRVS